MGDAINQLEFRWTDDSQRGFSVVASSNPRDDKMWEDRLHRLARPPQMRLRTSVVYQTFGGEAAIMFRHLAGPPGWTTGVSSANGRSEPARAALVARAVAGPAALLGPGLALACSALGVPRFLTPPLGEVQAGSLLPALSPGDLQFEAESDARIAYLDDSARNDLALAPLVAAVLNEPDTALALQVPDIELGEHSTAALLWGLWRITYPILGPNRDWTFSTAEPPPGNTDPGPLPLLVVRSLPQHGDPRPVTQREELIIQPRGARAAEASRPGTSTVADLLVTAYRCQPTEDFLELLQAASAAGATLADRLAAVSSRLQSFQAPLRDPRPAHEPGPGLYEAPRTVPARPETTDVPSPAHRGPSHARPQSGEAMNLAEDRVGRAFLRLAENKLDAIDDILDMREQTAPPDGPQRAALRRAARRYGWFIRQFSARYPREIEDCLQALFALIVVPDLQDPQHRPRLHDELARWMSDATTPAVVLLALESLIWERRDVQLQQRLLTVVGPRWLADHGRFGQLQPPAVTAGGPAPAGPALPWWMLVKHEHVSRRVANIGIYLVAIQVIVIVALAAGLL